MHFVAEDLGAGRPNDRLHDSSAERATVRDVRRSLHASRGPVHLSGFYVSIGAFPKDNQS